MSGMQLPSIFDWTAQQGQANQGAQSLGSFPSENYGSEAVAQQPQQPMFTPAPAPKPNPMMQAGQSGLGAANAWQFGNTMWGGGAAATPAAPAAAAEAPSWGAGAYELPTQLGVGGPTYQAPIGPQIGVALPAAAAVAGTYLGHQAADRSGPAAQTGWAVANAMNPINQAIEAPRALSGNKVGLGTQLALALPTAGGSFFINRFGSGKDADQQARDQVRANAVKNQWFSKDYQVDLGNGLVLDMGKDGGYKYTNPDGTERRFNNTDPGDQNAPQAIGWLRPLALIMSEGNEKMTSDFVAQFYNELTKDGKATDLQTVRARVIDLYKKFGTKPSMVRQAIEQLGLPKNIADASFAAIDNLRPGQTPQTQQAQQQSGPQPMNPKDPHTNPAPSPKRPEGRPIKPLGGGNGS